jgi:hypothetical protein
MGCCKYVHAAQFMPGCQAGGCDGGDFGGLAREGGAGGTRRGRLRRCLM